jgi:hypothetical protein
LQKDLQNAKISGIQLDSEKGTSTLKEMKDLIDKLVLEDNIKKNRIEVLEAEKKTVTSDFEA